MMVQPIGQPLPYAQFRCGVTFSEAAQELRRQAAQVLEQEGRRMFWTRSTVLGRMREIKLGAYEQYRRWFAPPPAWWEAE